MTSYTVSRREPPGSSEDRVGSKDLPATAEQRNHDGTPVKINSTVDGLLEIFRGREPQGIENELLTTSLFDPEMNVVLDSSSAKPRVEPTAHHSTKAGLKVRK